MRTRPTLTWTPTGPPLPTTTRVDEVVELVAGGGVVVLSGAGLSTESGIPDYRGASGSLRTHTPMTYQEFTASAEARKRYWARSHIGWRLMARATPNAGHLAVTALRDLGLVGAVITQNVDGLHQAAGATDTVNLHGCLDRVVCLTCRTTTPRHTLDARLHEANPHFAFHTDEINPDGDVTLPDSAIRDFHVVPCTTCAGPLKPDVVFFGENVPRDRVQLCTDLIDSARALLVLGSSLTVMSGLRFVRQAATAHTPIAIINQGPTRGDHHASTRVNLPLGQALTEIVTRVSTP